MDELHSQPKLDGLFRKGNEADKVAPLHSFRPFTADMRGVRQYPLTKTATDALMRSPPHAYGGRFTGKRADIERKPNKAMNQQDTHLVFGERCEQGRLQASINR